MRKCNLDPPHPHPHTPTHTPTHPLTHPHPHTKFRMEQILTCDGVAHCASDVIVVVVIIVIVLGRDGRACVKYTCTQASKQGWLFVSLFVVLIVVYKRSIKFFCPAQIVVVVVISLTCKGEDCQGKKDGTCCSSRHRCCCSWLCGSAGVRVCVWV